MYERYGDALILLDTDGTELADTKNNYDDDDDVGAKSNDADDKYSGNDDRAGGGGGLLSLFSSFRRRPVTKKSAPSRPPPPPPVIMLHLAATGDATAPSCVIVLSHGNGADLSDSAHLAHNLWRELGGHRAVVAYDYDGYIPAMNDDAAASTSVLPSEAGVHRSSFLVSEWVARRYPTTPVMYFGVSMGTAPALHMAVEFDAAGLLLKSPFTSILGTRGWILRSLASLVGVRDMFHNDEIIGEYRGDLLIMHGTDDDVVPFSNGQALFTAAHAAANKEFIAIDGAGHNNMVEIMKHDRFYAAVSDHVRRTEGTSKDELSDVNVL